jgi:hypothetical protein
MSSLHFGEPSTRLERLAILCAAVLQQITLVLRKEERRLRNIHEGTHRIRKEGRTSAL